MESLFSETILTWFREKGWISCELVGPTATRSPISWKPISTQVCRQNETPIAYCLSLQTWWLDPNNGNSYVKPLETHASSELRYKLHTGCSPSCSCKKFFEHASKLKSAAPKNKTKKDSSVSNPSGTPRHQVLELLFILHVRLQGVADDGLKLFSEKSEDALGVIPPVSCQELWEHGQIKLWGLSNQVFISRVETILSRKRKPIRSNLLVLRYLQDLVVRPSAPCSGWFQMFWSQKTVPGTLPDMVKHPMTSDQRIVQNVRYLFGDHVP